MTEAERKKWALVALIVILLGVVGFLAWQRFGGVSPVAQDVPQVSPDPTANPIIDSDNITSEEDFEEFTAGRPLPQPTTLKSIEPIDPETDHLRGNRLAPISVVQFSNLSNKYAQIVQPGLRELAEDRIDVNVVFRHYPLTTNQIDYAAAMMSECVARQGGNDSFWEFVDIVYERKIATEPELKAAAAEIGMLEAEIDVCMQTEITKRDVVADKRGAQIKGQFYTIPSFFFINNDTGETRFMQGVDTIDFMERIVDDMRS